MLGSRRDDESCGALHRSPLVDIVAIALLCALPVSGCAATCDNAGVTVDDRGNIVVRGESGFISPNSTILRNVSQWPKPPLNEQNFSFAQGYTLTRDGAMYVLENTAYHPNLVYRIDLATGGVAPIGPHNADAEHAAFAPSRETFIAAGDRYAYSVDQTDAVISRADLSAARASLSAFIAGPKTKLRSPIAIAADDEGRLCALDSEAVAVLCYADEHGDAPPTNVIDLKRLLGFAQGWALVFDRHRHVVVSGTTDQNGLTGFAIAVIDLAGAAPQVLRTIAGPKTQLEGPELAVDDRDDILALQSTIWSEHDLLAFGPDQHGNVVPRFVRRPAASVTHPFRLAIDRRTGDVAILGSDGVSLFRHAARLAPPEWTGEIRLPYRGWSVAFGGRSSLIVADQFGALETHGVSRATEASAGTRAATLNLHDPGFIASDQNGDIYVASTDGTITALPKHGEASSRLRGRSFETAFGRNMNAFAPDAAGYFYFSSASNDAILAVRPQGGQSVIEGPETNLDDPIGLAVDRDGSLFVANAAGKNVLVFARGASGSTAPAARIEGPATQLVAPQALAIDSAGRLYVFDGLRTSSAIDSKHYVRVYAANARGNVAPLQSYEVKTKCWTNAP
ncbi:MAG TPA: hypothetical protein VKR56_12230 [Candidatus Cybelea sp.]|nr:hypothetical protein [Candidatus Cybelea sp.]